MHFDRYFWNKLDGRTQWERPPELGATRGKVEKGRTKTFSLESIEEKEENGDLEMANLRHNRL